MPSAKVVWGQTVKDGEPSWGQSCSGEQLVYSQALRLKWTMVTHKQMMLCCGSSWVPGEPQTTCHHFPFLNNTIIVCMQCMLGAGQCQDAHMEFRGQLCGVGSLFPPSCEFRLATHGQEALTGWAFSPSPSPFPFLCSMFKQTNKKDSSLCVLNPSEQVSVLSLTAVIKHLDENNFGEKGFILAHSSGYSPSCWGTVTAGGA